MLFQNIKNLCWHLPKSIFFNILYGFPTKKLILIGITGTDGKTTTATLIHHILIKSGIKADLITTINSPGLHTTSPDPSDLQKLFQKMVQSGTTHCVCEVTSHALDQNRFWGCNFQVSAITNTTHEHLDYHKTMENYISAKTKLFTQSKFSILNADDQSFKIISPLLKTPYKTYSIKNKSDYQAKNIRLTSKSLNFLVNRLEVTTDSAYQYQTYNILAALAVVQHLNIDPKISLAVIKKFPVMKGRREEVKINKKIRTIIDFAHTPAALEKTLSSIKKTTKGKLIVIFGATGGRDKLKRPIMGKVVSENSDIAIITADDTRNEKIEDINQQIINGIVQKTDFTYHNIPNRQDAFNLAAKLAKPGDVIVACGKGHETSILHGSTEYPWSEIEAFRTAFRNISQ